MASNVHMKENEPQMCRWTLKREENSSWQLAAAELGSMSAGISVPIRARLGRGSLEMLGAWPVSRPQELCEELYFLLIAEILRKLYCRAGLAGFTQKKKCFAAEGS